MSFIIAKDFHKLGSVVYKAPADLDIASTVRDLEDKYEETDLQIVTTGRCDVYREYEPMIHVESLDSFKSEIASMTNHKTAQR